MKNYDEIKEILRIGGRDNFWLFCLHYDYDFFTKRIFLKEIAIAFQGLYDEYKNDNAIKISVSLPPRSGKSYITSLFCSWWLGNEPELSVMRNTCTTTLYKKFSYDVRAIVKSEQYKEVFKTVQLSSDKQNLDGWNLTTSKQVGYFGAGVGGTIIGFGANIAITDDLYKDLYDARSPVVQESVSMWKQSAHNSRMEKHCPEIFIGTRWTKKDEIGKAIESGKLAKIIAVPALTENGKSFCEDVKTTAEYLAIKNEIDEEIWEAEYMQEPIEKKGLLFPASELNYYNPETTDIEKLAEFRFTFIDPADEGGDDLSAPAAYLIGNKLYITDVIYNKHGTDVNEPACIQFILNHKMDAVEIEGNSAWVLFGKAIRNKIQEKSNHSCSIRIVKQYKNKHTRILAQSSFIKNNFVFRKDWETIPEYRRFMQNIISYNRIQEGSSKNKHEDAVDSCAGIANYFSKHFTHLY